MVEVKLILQNELGLHARPAADFTKLASKYKSRITLKGNGKAADGKSIIMVLTMGVRKGGELIITADGPDEVECIEALRALVESNFNGARE